MMKAAQQLDHGQNAGSPLDFDELSRVAVSRRVRGAATSENQPMVIGYHLVWTAYGWWLPNDPRGSMSRTIHRDVLSELGDLHYGRKRIQPASRVIREFYENAQGLLHYPLLYFSEAEVQTIVQSFAETIRNERYTCHACAIMPDHIHILIRKHRDLAEKMIENLQLASCKGVRALGTRDKFHPVWGGCGWKVFLDSVDDVRRTVKYIRDNPTKAGLAAQSWDLVVPYDNWPFHKRPS